MKKAVLPDATENKLTPEKRREIEAAYARRDMEFLRQSFASTNPAVSEYAERFVEQLVELTRSERDRSDNFSLKKKLSTWDQAETDEQATPSASEEF
jgi:hypothetical protein